jgi:oligopeptide transport system permease protein
MLRFIVVRLLQTIPVLIVVATVTFFMVRSVPGGPFDSEKSVSPEIKKQLEAYYGLDKPLWRQYVDYMARLGTGDLGPSLKYTNRTVKEMILETFPLSMKLGLFALSIALVFGISAGVMAALKPNTLLDYFASSVSILGICLPTFVTGPILVLVFALNLRWFNASGYFDSSDYVLPAIALGFAYAAYVSRMTRGGMLEIMNQDFIRTARAKGASETRVVLRHALRGGLLPVVSFLGPATAGIMTGSFVIESIFQLPGIGRHFVTSVFNRDHTMVIGTALFFATLLVLLNLLVDVVLVWLNPKLKLQ